MMTERTKAPEMIKLRNAGIHHTEGREIWTNVGMGYDKTKYIRADLIKAKDAEIERLREAINIALDTVTIEINPSNYGHDDVCLLNDQMIEAMLGLQAASEPPKDQTND